MGKIRTTNTEKLRDKIKGDAEFLQPKNEEEWRAKVGGGVVAAHENGVLLLGNTEKLERKINQIEGQGAEKNHAVSQGGRATLHFDGASRGNPGPSSAAYVITDDGVVDEDSIYLGETTNNEAEYRALIEGIEAATKMGFGELEAVGDSQLVVKQVKGEWACRSDNLQPLLDTVEELTKLFDYFEIRHVPRELNERSDKLANQELDQI